MLTDIVVNEVSVHVGEGALTPAAQVTAGILCMDKGSARAGLSCFDTKHNTDVLVAKMVGQGNEGAKLEGTIWTINLRYSVSCGDDSYRVSAVLCTTGEHSPVSSGHAFASSCIDWRPLFFRCWIRCHITGARFLLMRYCTSRVFSHPSSPTLADHF